MRDGLYKIVFKGEIGFDFDVAEVKASLQKFCGFDRPTVDRLFAGGTFVLMKNLDETKANSLRDAFQKFGAFTAVLPMAPVETPAAAGHAELAAAPIRAAEACVCPACGHRQAPAESCPVCGVFFAKFARVQERRAQEWLQPPAGQGASAGDEAVRPGWVALFTRLAAQPFMVRCGLLILGVAGLQALLGPGLLSTGFIILLSLYALFILVRGLLGEQEVMAGLAERFNVLWEQEVPAASGKQWVPWATYGFILLDLLLYYGLALQLQPATLQNSLAVLSAEPNFWNVPLSAVAALFLPSGGGQLWGGVLFLWALGPQVEKRLGRRRFLGLYLLTGIVAGGAGTFLQPLALLEPLHGLGSSCAIAGLLGFCVARSVDRSLEFAPPLLDLLPFFAPLRLRVRLDAFAFIGLFFYVSPHLGGSLAPPAGLVTILIGHLIHMAGMLTGLAVGATIASAEVPDDEQKATGVAGGCR
jgi:membrane associated rhomboid family serine protease